MIVYEVNLFVQRAIEREFRAWLQVHVQEIVALDGFTGAQVLERIEPAAATSEVVFCTQYRLTDEAALSGYISRHAPRMRADGLARFGDQFRAERRVLRAIADY